MPKLYNLFSENINSVSYSECAVSTYENRPYYVKYLGEIFFLEPPPAILGTISCSLTTAHIDIHIEFAWNVSISLYALRLYYVVIISIYDRQTMKLGQSKPNAFSASNSLLLISPLHLYKERDITQTNYDWIKIMEMSTMNDFFFFLSIDCELNIKIILYFWWCVRQSEWILSMRKIAHLMLLKKKKNAYQYTFALYQCSVSTKQPIFLYHGNFSVIVVQCSIWSW